MADLTPDEIERIYSAIREVTREFAPPRTDEEVKERIAEVTKRSGLSVDRVKLFADNYRPSSFDVLPDGEHRAIMGRPRFPDMAANVDGLTIKRTSDERFVRADGNNAELENCRQRHRAGRKLKTKHKLMIGALARALGLTFGDVAKVVYEFGEEAVDVLSQARHEYESEIVESLLDSDEEDDTPAEAVA